MADAVVSNIATSSGPPPAPVDSAPAPSVPNANTYSGSAYFNLFGDEPAVPKLLHWEQQQALKE